MTVDPDPQTRGELGDLIESARSDEEALAELQDRFSGRLEFGTAGIRGVLGAGPMRMNCVVIRQVSAGLASYLAREVENARERGIVVGYDARRNSRVFAEEAARVFLGMGFKVHFGEEELPTPVTSFAVDDTGAAAGVMVTASHNPPEYNGYKVYWGNGAQIIPPHDSGISADIEKVGDVSALTMPELAAHRADGRLVSIEQALVER